MSDHLGARGRIVLIAGGIAVIGIIVAFAPLVPGRGRCGSHRLLVPSDATTVDARWSEAGAEIRAFAEQLRRRWPRLDVATRDVDERGVRRLSLDATQHRLFSERFDVIQIERNGADLCFGHDGSTVRRRSLVGFTLDQTDGAIVAAIDAETDRIGQLLRGQAPPVAPPLD